MRAGRSRAQPTDHVRFAQTWQARPISATLFEIEGGGALAFVDLTRTDTLPHRWRPRVVASRARRRARFLSAPVHRSARLAYRHEVLLYVPESGAKPFALGEYGGLVSADGS